MPYILPPLLIDLHLSRHPERRPSAVTRIDPKDYKPQPPKKGYVWTETDEEYLEKLAKLCDL